MPSNNSQSPLLTELRRSYNDGSEGLNRFYRVHGEKLAEKLAADGHMDHAMQVARDTHVAKFEIL